MKKSIISILTGIIILVTANCVMAADEWTTKYTKTETTAAELQSAGWVFPSTASVGTSGNISMGSDSRPAYVWYNNDLGTKYKVYGSFTKIYNAKFLYFNATEWNTDNSCKNAFVVEIPKDWSTTTMKLKKRVNGSETVIASLDNVSNVGVNFGIEYNNGIGRFVLYSDNTYTTESYVLEFDVTEYIEEKPVLASGAIGTWYDNVNSLGWSKLEYQVPKLTAEFPEEKERPLEKPVEIKFNEPVTVEEVTDALEITPSADFNVTVSEDGKTAYAVFENLRSSTDYVLTLNPFSGMGGVLDEIMTYNFTTFKSVIASSESFNNVMTIKSGESVSVWIELSDKLSVKSVELSSGTTTVTADYNSETGRYAAEIAPTETGKLYFKITDSTDFVIDVASKHNIYLEEYHASPEGFTAADNTKVTSLSDITDGKVTASFDSDIEKSLAIICFYDADGAMKKIICSEGKSAVMENLPQDLSGCTVKAMLIKSFGEPAMLCGGMELN